MHENLRKATILKNSVPSNGRKFSLGSNLHIKINIAKGFQRYKQLVKKVLLSKIKLFGGRSTGKKDGSTLQFKIFAKNQNPLKCVRNKAVCVELDSNELAD